jgi:2'-5' RNA ligase
MRRIFVAVDISEEARERAAKYIAVMRGDLPKFAASWVRPEKLHLTLRFIGDCDDAELKKVTEVVDSVSAGIHPFRINIIGTGVFPNEKRARVLWLGVGGETNQMIKAKDLFENEYHAAGLLGKREALTPHLTIARIKNIGRCREVVAAHLNSQFGPVEFEVSELVVYESKLNPKGSIYSVVAKYNLVRNSSERLRQEPQCL